MLVGVTMFTTDRCMDPAAFALAAEQRGFASVYFPEHTHMPVRNSEPPSLVEGVELWQYKRSLDPFAACAAAAAVTERILLGTGVALIAQHDPIVLAKTIATVDHLSGGRFVLGFGYGWNRDELEDHGIAFKDRRAIAREKLQCMQQLWSEEVAAFEGEFVRLPPTYSWPKPVQQPRVRTLLGGGAGPKLFAAIAEGCDGWMPIGGAGLAASLADLRAATEEAGRDPGQLHIVPMGTLPNPGKMDYYRSIGVTEVVLRVPAGEPDAVLATLDSYAQYLPS